VLVEEVTYFQCMEEPHVCPRTGEELKGQYAPADDDYETRWNDRTALAARLDGVKAREKISLEL